MGPSAFRRDEAMRRRGSCGGLDRTVSESLLEGK